MRRFISLLFCLVVLTLGGSAAAKLRVVATTADLAAVAKEIGGDDVSVTALALHTQDPHWVDARPHLALELAKADLLLVTGLDLEIGWLPNLLTGARNGDIQPGAKGYLDCSKFIKPLDVPASVDRAQGDLHPHGSPHYMLDPRRAAKVIQGIAKKLAELDPSHAKAFEKRGGELSAKVLKWSRHWQKQLAKLKGKPVIAYHKSLSYLAEWIGFEVVEHVEPRPGIPPNPRHVTQVITVARDKKVPLLLQETWFPASTSKLVAEKSSVRLVEIPGQPNYRGNQSYIGFMNELVKRIAKAL